MRDPNRIRPLIDALERVWRTNPDLRFGQIMDILIAGLDGMHFYVEDDVWQQRLEGLDLSPSAIAGKYRGDI
jgi:hypothetical protein